MAISAEFFVAIKSGLMTGFELISANLPFVMYRFAMPVLWEGAAAEGDVECS